MTIEQKNDVDILKLALKITEAFPNEEKTSLIISALAAVVVGVVKSSPQESRSKIIMAFLMAVNDGYRWSEGLIDPTDKE